MEAITKSCTQAEHIDHPVNGGNSSHQRCPCGEQLDAYFTACPSCGHEIATSTAPCPTCTKPTKGHWKICPFCRAALSGFATPTTLKGRGTAPDRAGAPFESHTSDNGQIYVSQLGPEARAARSNGPVRLPIAPGDVLAERYTVRQFLGAGGFGAVYLVDDAVLETKRALKIVAVASGAADGARDPILHEFKLRERITDTSHIVRSDDPRLCSFKGLCLILLPMEWADGGSLRAWMAKNNGNPERRAPGLKLFRETCQGVAAIHAAGLGHLDMKPENILLTDGSAKVTDFGIGRFLGAQFGSNPDQLLRQGVGTPQYMSPEQFRTARQKEVGPASDIYSLGVVLYELLDGALPFDGSPEELREKHLNVAPAPLKGETARWWPILQRCLAKDSESRYPDVSHLIADLDRANDGSTLSADVACPSCHHVNVNPQQEACERCKTALTALFRDCPQCSRRNRLDSKACPGCGYGVAAYYLQLERRQTVARLKEEDPVAAVELLEQMLRDGAEDDEVALVKSLRARQVKIQPWLTGAAEAVASGKQKNAFEFWRRVLGEFPRHRIALPELQKAAETAVSEGETAFANHDPVLAKEKANWALGVLAGSPMAKALLTKATKAIGGAQELLEQAAAAMKAARFDDATARLRDAERAWPTIPGLEPAKSSLQRTQELYQSLMTRAREAQAKNDLAVAVESAEAASRLCPDDSKSTEILNGCRSAREKVGKLIAAAQNHIRAAQFDKAADQLSDAKKLWPQAPRSGDTESRLTSVRAAYSEHINKAEQSLTLHCFSAAAAACREARHLCPESSEAAGLAGRIERAQSDAADRRTKLLHAAKMSLKWLVIGGACLFALWIGWLIIQEVAHWTSASAWPWIQGVCSSTWQWIKDWGIGIAIALVLFIGCVSASPSRR